MLGAALREGDDAHPVPPASKVWVAGEERFEFGLCGAPQPSEVGLVEALVGARRIAVSAFSVRHVEADITGGTRDSRPLLSHRPAGVLSLYGRGPMCRARCRRRARPPARAGWWRIGLGVDLVGPGGPCFLS